MLTPDINFKSIRLHRGVRSDAFEELCCQLAADESDRLQARFVRKGRGADGGVEAFATLSGGNEIGWQVKYYWDIDGALASLSESLARALATHPRMSRFVVCIPFDPSDGRRAKKRSALDKWNDWRSRSKADALARGRQIEIELWAASSLKDRLMADPKAAGRIAFWFDATLLTQEWFKQKLGRSIRALGSRYTAESHVALPIRHAILATTRDPGFHAELVRLLADIEGPRSRLAAPGSELGGTALAEADAAITCLHAACRLETEDYPLADILSALSRADTALAVWRQDLHTAENKEAAQDVARLYTPIAAAHATFSSQRWRLINARRLLVYGEGGRGKSHLLADACQHQIDQGRPALLLPSNWLQDADPWPQVVKLLDLPITLQTEAFLSALNTAAMAQGVRALLVIDGLNERHGQRIWNTHLAGFLNDTEAYPWITVVVSCRSTYLEATIPADMDETYLPRLEHHGFSAADAERYLEQRGFTILEAPWPLDEFETPLFLKTLCDGLAAQGEFTLPRGANGLSAIFKLYAETIAAQIARDLCLNARQRYVERTLDALADEMARTGDTSIFHARADEIAQAILPHAGALEKDLLYHLISAGALADDQINADAFVRFTFERFGDFTVAQGLLVGCRDGADVKKTLTERSLLNQVMSQRSSQLDGVLEALAVLLPESYGIELMDVSLPKPAIYYAQRAFDLSLETRDAKAFSARTWELVRSSGGEAAIWDLLIRLSGEPEATLHGPDLHTRLLDLPMPERDADWSIYLARSSETAGPLIDWALQPRKGSVAGERALGLATTLTWCLSATDRRVRDRATKALVSVLAERPEVCLELLSRFASVDDGYVFERLLCAMYGAALQGRWPPDRAAEVAQAVDQRIFRAGPPPVNCLTREHAQLLVRWAVERGALPADYDLAASQGPFTSQWPIDHVPDAVIASFTQTYPNGSVGADDIVGSCVRNGDFARYVLDRALRAWSAGRLGVQPLPTTQDLHDRWEADFDRSATPEQQAAYSALETVMTDASEGARFRDTAAQTVAKSTFAAAVGSDMFERWREEAENWRRGGMYQHPSPSDHAEFNLAWARRWVCFRAHELGWSEALHGDFDMRLRNDRMTHDVERIGKKYQWLALYELRARMADNLEPLEAPPTEEPDELRNIDPSLLAGGEPHDADAMLETPEPEEPWRPRIALPAVGLTDALVWRDDEINLLDGMEAIEIEVYQRPWLVLKRSDRWRGGPETLQRELSRWVTCVVVPRDQLRRFRQLVEGKTELDHDRFHDGESRVPWRSYLGEHPWRGACDVEDGWQHDWRPGFKRTGEGVSVRATTIGYLAEDRDYDRSLARTIDAQLPAAWLMKALDLRLGDGRAIRYVDASDQVQFRDLAADGGRGILAVVDKAALLSMLERQRLAAVWLIAGEKNIFGSPHSRGFGGRRYYARVIDTQGSDFALGARTSALSAPSREQLEALTAEAG